jgi:hypothetical protein
MLSISGSRYRKVAQIGFLALNGIGLALSVIYTTKTPDLYPHNAHHKLGWVVSVLVLVQVAIGLLANVQRSSRHQAYRSLSQRVVDNTSLPRTRFLRSFSTRFSQDSGHGTASESSSRSTSCSEESRGDHGFEQVLLNHGQYPYSKSRWSWMQSTKPLSLFSGRVQALLRLYYNAIDRTILLLGFAALATGWVTYSGLFKGQAVFSGLAHFIKGGVFFWLGVLSLGRWAGSFQDIGWSWNLKPTNVGKRVPSAEFVESFLIFFYGSTNVFLEHLAAWGKPWTAVDLEHISLTIVFFGGGVVSTSALYGCKLH